MIKLNFPSYQFRFKNSENKTAIFDELRKKFIILTPEEWVRQHTIQYLIQQKNYPKQLLNAEKQLKVNGLTRRYDIVAYNPNGSINLIVECKAPSIKITQDTFDQIARYNLALKAERVKANYIAFGSFFKSSTKKSPFKANLATLHWAKKKINMPIVAIGGINDFNYKKILSNGADFIACSNYIWNNKKLDPVSAIKKFK
jgi:hypothetical protein